MLVRDCEQSGLLLSPGTERFPAEEPAPFVRLNYSGPHPAAYPEAARILGRALAHGSG